MNASSIRFLVALQNPISRSWTKTGSPADDFIGEPKEVVDIPGKKKVMVDGNSLIWNTDRLPCRLTYQWFSDHSFVVEFFWYAFIHEIEDITRLTSVLWKCFLCFSLRHCKSAEQY